MHYVLPFCKEVGSYDGIDGVELQTCHAYETAQALAYLLELWCRDLH